MTKKLYIAYGSNMDTEQMALRCQSAKLIGTSEISGYELLFKGSKSGSYATIEKNKNSKVPVLIWEITELEERNLDRYEGYPSFYYKKNITLPIDGKFREAMAYIMDEKRLYGQPRYNYYKVLEDTYTRFGFDLDILEKALEVSISREVDLDV
jgi:hypothetical protein